MTPTMDEIRGEIERLTDIGITPDPSQYDDLCRVLVVLARRNLEHQEHFGQEDEHAVDGLIAIADAFAHIHIEEEEADQ